MKRLILTILIIQCAIASSAQDSLSNRSYNMFGEVGGSSFLSINIERLYPISKNLKLSGRIGLGRYESELSMFGNEGVTSSIIPLNCNFIVGKKQDFETGVGLAIGLDKTSDIVFKNGPLKWINLYLGYRYQSPKYGFLFRAGINPWLRFPTICENSNCSETKIGTEIFPMPGISLGFRVK